MRCPPCCVFNADRKCVPLFYGGEATLIDSSCPFVVTAVIDQVDPLLAWGVSFLAVVIGAFRGRDYGQLIENHHFRCDRLARRVFSAISIVVAARYVL